MHNAVHDFIKSVKKKFPDHFTGKRVLELGSLDMNGNPRSHFSECDYTGVDWRKGRCVDVVCRVHEFVSDPFDVVISTEMLEHDKHADFSVKRAWNLVSPGGLLIATMANEKRGVHERQVGEDAHYEGIPRERVEEWIGSFSDVKDSHIDELGHDIRFWVLRSENES